MTRPAMVAGLLAPTVAAWAASAQPYALGEPTQDARGAIEVVSSRPDLVSGGDALIRLEGARPKLKVNGADATAAFRRTAPNISLGLVTGLRGGLNVLESGDGRLEIYNWPSTGPVISGPHERPFICMTDAFMLPVTGGVLGPPQGEACDARARVDYLYRTRDGVFKPLPADRLAPADAASLFTPAGRRTPFVVRVETAVVNRSIYQLAVPHDPRAGELSFAQPSTSWNGALVFHFGGGCPGGWYIQGRRTAGVLEPEMLARGYAVASSTLNVFGNNCNDLLASETLMMVKERVVERLGPPRHTIGWGCSGGSYQALQSADNYPGLLDGIVVGCSFPDVGHAAVSVHSFGAVLLQRYFAKSALVWTAEQKVSVSGLADEAAIKAQSSRGDRIAPNGVCDKALPEELRYHPQRNPRGARCTVYDHAVNVYGRDPRTGFARRPLDNVGVQYGLQALNDGVIGKAQFIELNRLIGGVDIDAKYTPERTAADPVALGLAYRSGRVLWGGAGLSTTPIIDYRAYADFDDGDPHMRFHSFSIRERLLAANGDFGNHVMLTESSRWGLFSLKSPVLSQALDQMEAWLQRLPKRPTRAKVLAAKPRGLEDACFQEGGARIAELQEYGRGRCHELFPAHANPYLAAGAPLANNVLKCVTKPVSPTDYSVDFSATELAQLRTIFPSGVCDYSRPGEGQRPLAGAWLSVGPAGARR